MWLDFWFRLWEPAIKQTMKVMDEMSVARRRELTREYQEQQANCIYPDCLISTDFGKACEHSCQQEEQEREKREGKGP